MKKIKINLSQNSYEILIGKNTIEFLINEIDRRAEYDKLFSVIDRNVLNKHHAKLRLNLLNHKNHSGFYEFQSEEKLKTFPSARKILSSMIENKLGRRSLLLAIGGGIAGDIGGFAASIYMRGVKYVQVPTTLLSAVDSSVGGKTGINFAETKNIIGAFHQPILVLVDIEFLKTLPQRELVCGLGEIIKYAFITDVSFYNYIEDNIDGVLNLDDKVLTKIIYESIKFKANIVMSDERETGIRKMLNLGHTFAHALEIEHNHTLKHGQAVIAGIACSLFMSYKLGLIDGMQLEKYVRLISRFKPHIKLRKLNHDRIYTIMQRDKKISDGKVKFVLIKNIGEAGLDVDADKNIINYSLRKTEEIFLD